MPLRFIGIDPTTGQDKSPTVFVDEETNDIVIQGFKPGGETEAEVAAFEVPGHAIGIPADEAVIRIPARMAPFLREACDAVERADVR